VSFKSLTEGG